MAIPVDILGLLGAQPLAEPNASSLGTAQDEGAGFDALMMQLLGGTAVDLNGVPSSESVNPGNRAQMLLGKMPFTLGAIFADGLPEGETGIAIGNTRFTDLMHSQISVPPTLNKAVDLPQGTYEILSAKVESGNLHLEIAASDSQNSRINITVPARDLIGSEDVFSQDPLKGLRAPLNGSFSLGNHLEDLLSKLNLKELHVTDAARAAGDGTSGTNSPAEMRIVAENAGAQVVLRARLSKTNATIANSDAAQRSPIRGTVGSGQAAELDPNASWSIVNRAGLVQSGKGTSSSIGQQGLLQVRSELAEGWKDSTALAGSESTEEPFDLLFAASESSRSGKGATSGRNVIRPRFVLPTDIQSQLKPNGQSVMLRIEPQNLGPARLNLYLRNDKLSARLVVESPAAKQMVEGSLDRLVTQLNEANIEVDRIEVSVSSDAADHEPFGQPHGWGRPTGRKISASTEPAAEVNEQPVHLAVQGPTQYVGAGGVDLLA